MILTIQGIPCHLILLKGTEEATDAETKASSSKWLGFAKGYAIKCLNLSRQTRGWVTKTTKLPSKANEGTDEGEKFQFLMVKCHAEAKYCLIVIRSVLSVGIHGIILTPCSSLSPDGWGKPITETNTPWGTPGVAENHNLDLTSYAGEQNGVGTQGVLTYEEWAETKDEDPTWHPRFKHGTEWFPFVDTKYAASEKKDYAVGGFLAVTPTKDIAEPDDAGFEKITTSGGVYSVGARWLPAFRNYWDVNPDSTVSVIEEEVVDQYGYADYYYGDKINHFAKTPLFKNGKVASVSGASGYVLGVGFRKATVSGTPVDKMLMVTASGSNYIVYAADAPYKTATQLLVIPGSFTEQAPEQDPDKNLYFPGFFFNQSGTKASAIVYSWKTRTMYGGAQDRTLEPNLYRLAFNDDASEVTLEIAECPGCVGDKGSEFNEYTREDGWHVLDSYYYSYSKTSAKTPIAVGFHRDQEKVLYVDYEATQGTRQVEWRAALILIRTELGPKLRTSVDYYINDNLVASLEHSSETLTIKDKRFTDGWTITTETNVSGSALLKLHAVDFINDVLYYSVLDGAGNVVGSHKLMANNEVLSVIPGVEV